MITKSDIKKLSALARIDISSKEEEDLASELGSILSYFEKLKESSSENSRVKPAESEENLGFSLREDMDSNTVYENVAALVGAAPETENGFIKVKAVFNRA